MGSALTVDNASNATRRESHEALEIMCDIVWIQAYVVMKVVLENGILSGNTVVSSVTTIIGFGAWEADLRPYFED